MPETVLCAVDDSEAAGRVLATGRWLAEALPARLVIVHAVDGSGADELPAALRTRLGDEPADVRLVHGSAATAILETAAQEGAELVVVGSRGRGPIHSAMLGSVSRKLAAEAPCPVVIVPAGERPAETDGADASVVCGVDGSDRALVAAAFAGRLARRLGLRPVVVHARQNLSALRSYPGAASETPPVTGQEDAVQKLAADVLRRGEEAAGDGAVGIIEPGPPTEVLQSVAGREEARLIVIAARGYGGLRAAVLGSVAAELPAEADRPVVVLSESAVGPLVPGSAEE
jgi:nucleotide-binding universal stress UspA family protein